MEQSKTLYHVDWVLERINGPMTKLNRKMDKEELEKFIGRYTMNYGPPLDLTDGRQDIFVYEFCRREKTGDTIGTLKFWRAMTASNPPPKKEEGSKQPEQVQAMLDANVLEETNKWGY